MDEPLAQRILDIIFQDPQVRRLHKESLADWILDTQPRTAPWMPRPSCNTWRLTSRTS